MDFFLPDVALLKICTQVKKNKSDVLPFGKMTKQTYIKCQLSSVYITHTLQSKRTYKLQLPKFFHNLNFQLQRTLTCLHLFIFLVMEWLIIYTNCLNSNWVVLGIVHCAEMGCAFYISEENRDLLTKVYNYKIFFPKIFCNSLCKQTTQIKLLHKFTTHVA